MSTNASTPVGNGSIPAPRADGGVSDEPPSYKWLVLIAVVFGVFMSILDSTVVNVALAKLQAVFGVTLHEIQWVVTGYLLAVTVSIPVVGYLADRFGVKRVYITALVLFTLGSALCGLAWSAGSLTAFRILQGLGGGGLLPLATAMLFSVFPPQERGRASAALGAPILLAPALGPSLGGYLVQYADWRLIFYLNVPVGVVAVFMATVLLRERRSPNPGRLDWPGVILSSVGFASLVYGVDQAATHGWSSSQMLLPGGIGVLSLIALVLTELRTENPLLDMRLFRDWSFTSGNVVIWVMQMALFGGLLLLPIFLQELRGLTPFQTGLWLLPSALVTAVILPIGGLLVDRIGAKWVILVGAVALTLTTYSLSYLNLSTTFWTLQTILLGRSVAISFTLQPANVVALYNVPRPALARASSLLSALRQVAASFGTALLATYLQNRQPLHYARLAEQTTIFSPAARLVAEATVALQARGMDAVHARQAALMLLSGLLQRQAAVLSFSDTYLLTSGIAVLAVITAFFLRNRPAPAIRPATTAGRSASPEDAAAAELELEREVFLVE